MEEIYKVALQGSGFVNWLNFDQPMTFNEDLVLTQVYETLFNKNEYGQIENNLVSHYKHFKNSLLITIKPRAFHDGSPLTSNDIINSLKQAFLSPYKHNNNGWTGDLLNLSEKNFQFINLKQFSIDIKNLCLQDVLEELTKVKYSIKKGVLGTGPYVVDTFNSQDQKLILKRNHNHPMAHECVSELHLIGYKNNFETLKAFLNKEVDQVRIWGLQSPFQYNPNTLMVPSKTFYASYFQFNTESKKFENNKKRTQFRDVFLQNIMLHNNYPWNRLSGIVPGDQFKAPQHRLKTAQPIEVILGVAHKRQKKEVERIINKNFFKNLGYKIEIKNYESYTALYNSQADLIYTAFSYEQHNKHRLPEIFHSKHKKNKTKFKSKSIDQMIENDIATAEIGIWNQALVIPLGWFQCHILTHKDSSIFCGIKNNKVTPVLYKSKVQDFIELFSQSQYELFRLREKNWSQLSQKAKLKEVMTQFQHDIKSPLSVLKMMSQNISNTKEIYQRVLKRVEEFSLNIEKEIALSLDPTSMESECKSLNLNAIIHELIQEKLQKDFININFKTHLDCKIENLNLSAPPLKRVLSNLINNAIEARNKWNHQVELKTYSDESHIYIIIKDNGKGFSAEHLQSALQAPGFTSKAKGQGLGLYSSKKYVENLGGEFNVLTQQYLGTTITIKLKLPPVLKEDHNIDGVQKFGT